MSGEQEQIRFIEDAIRGQRQLRRLQLGLAILAVVLGVALMVVLQWFRVGIVEDNVKLFGQLGGAFVATLSSFPIKQLYDRGFKIAALELLLSGFRRMANGEASADEAAGLKAHLDKLVQTAWAT